MQISPQNICRYLAQWVPTGLYSTSINLSITHIYINFIDPIIMMFDFQLNLVSRGAVAVQWETIHSDLEEWESGRDSVCVCEGEEGGGAGRGGGGVKVMVDAQTELL